MTCTFVAATPPTVTEVANAVVNPEPKIVMLVDAAPVAPDGSAVFGVMLMTASAGTEYVNAPFVETVVESGLVTVTLTASCSFGGPSGVRAVIEVGLTTTTSVAARAPKVTVAPVWKFVPVMVTNVPPDVGPLFGEMLPIVGEGSVYVNACDSVADWPSVFVTTTSTLPAACAGAVAVIDVAVAETFVAETPPNFTVGLLRNPVPLIVTTVPPPMLPLVGRMLATVGAGFATAFTFIVPNMVLCPEPQSGRLQTNANVPGVVAVN